MIKKSIIYICFIFLLFYIGGCAPSHYSLGKKSLENEEYESAIEFLELAREEDPEDPKVLRELGIAHYSQIEFSKAIPLLIQAFLIDTTDGRTLFYLGTAFEITGDISSAMDIYKRYIDVASTSSIRSSIEGRLAKLMRKKMESQIKEILAHEEAIDANAIPDSTVAVLYFKNVGERRDLDPIQKGLAEMLITDLSKVKSLQVIERIKMQKMMEEMGLGMTGLVDDKTAPRVGRLLGVTTLIKGAFLDLSGDNLRIDAGLVETKKKTLKQTKPIRGQLDQFFKLEKDLAFGIVEQMGITLTQEERDAIEIIPTENLLAFMAYCRGLDYEDRGLFQEASQEYRNAIQLDPGFIQVGQNLSQSEKLSAGETEIEDLEQQMTQSSDEAEKKETTQAAAEADEGSTEEQSESVTDQMMHTGAVLDQGFLPGLDSREPAQEQTQSSFGSSAEFDIVVPLPQ